MARARGIGNQTRRITGPPRANLHGKLTAGDFPDIGDQLPDRPATPGTKIERRTLRAIEQRPHRFDMSIRKIGYVDVITDTGAVGGGIIVAENREALLFSGRRIKEERNDMRLGDVTLADLAIGIGTRGIKITQRNERERKRHGAFPQHALANHLRGAVRINRRVGALFGDGNDGRRAIDGATRRKHHLADAAFAHGLEQRSRSADIVLVIKRRA